MRLGELAKVLKDQQIVNIISNEIFSCWLDAVGWTFSNEDIKGFGNYDSDFYDIKVLNIFSKADGSDIFVTVDCNNDELHDFVKKIYDYYESKNS